MLIELKDICKSYSAKGMETFHALKNINISIESGEMVAIKGASGAGKSTLLNIIGCIDSPISGKYILDFKDISKISSSEMADIRNKTFGFITQHFALIEDDNVIENVTSPLLFSKTPLSLMDALAIERLRSLNILHLAKKRVAKLSGGEKQRVAIARAMVSDPKIILADEPTGALDTANSQNIINIFKKMNEEGKTIIIVTHDDFIANSCKRIITIEDGQVKQ